MLNSYSKAYNNLNIPATSGTLIKSHPKSFTLTYEFGSKTDERLHNESPFLFFNKDYYTKIQCVVIQTMVIGEKLFMSEVVRLSDYLESEVGDQDE